MAQAPEFQEAQNIIAEAKSMFETVPSRIRSDFKNDPELFIAFMQNPKNREAIEDYGLDASHLHQSEAIEKTNDDKTTKKQNMDEKEEKPEAAAEKTAK